MLLPFSNSGCVVPSDSSYNPTPLVSRPAFRLRAPLSKYFDCGWPRPPLETHLKTLSSLFLVALFLPVICSAQAADEAGIKPFATLQGGPVEDVNLSNHTINLHPTLLSYPQRGGKLAFNLVVQYANATWQETENCLPGIPKTCFWTWVPNSDGVAKVNVVLSHGIPFWFTQPLNTQQNPPPLAYFVKLSDGSTHPAGQIGTNLYETIDSTGILFNTSTADVTFPDGVRANPNSFTLIDTNGNQITQTSSGWVDTMGRNIPAPPSTNGNIASGGVATTDFSHCTGQLPIDSAALWTVPGPNGGPSTYKFCFVKVHVFTHHWTTDDSTHSEINSDEVEIQSIVLPDNTAWTFDYSQPDANGVNWGDLVKITLPTGGSISYVWQTSHGCSVSYKFTDASYRAVTQRTIDPNDGSGPQAWTYSGNTVTDPSGNDTVHTFTNLSGCSIYETQTQTFTGSQSAGKLVQSVTTQYSWNPDPYVPFTTPATPPTAINVVASSRTTTLANGMVRQTGYTYDSGFAYGGTNTGLYGKVATQVETDWGQGSPGLGPTLRETDTQYQFLTDSTGAYKNANLLETPNSVIVKDGAGNIVAKTTYGYDEAFSGISTEPTGITTQHTTVGGVRGNRSSTTKWLLLSNTPVTSRTFAYDTGEPYQAIDSNGNTTTYSYDPAYVGGFQTMTCRPTTGTVQHCVSGTYDPNTGHLLSFTDENAAFQASGTSQGDPAHTITYGYNDPLGRLTSITYPADSAGHHPQTTFNYSLPGVLPVSVQQLRTIAGTTKDDSTTYFDGLGREFKAVHTSAGGATVIKTYDPVGRVASVTNPYISTADPTYGVTQYNYDPLGRVTKTTKQDGSFSTMDYSGGNCIVGTDEAGTQMRRCSDGLGRITEVDEPGDAFSGTNASGSINIAGTLQSTLVGATPAIAGTGSVTISGFEQSTTTNPCAPIHKSCPATAWDSGTVFFTANGHTDQATYTQGDTASSVATRLAAMIRQNSPYVNYTNIVVNSATSVTIYLTARSTGQATNYSISSTSTSNAPTVFFPSFTGSPSGTNLSGGTNAFAGTPVYDSGKVTMSVGGLSATANYGNGVDSNGNPLDSTGAAVAADLVKQINAQLPASNPPFSISVPANSTAITIGFSGPGVQSATVTSTTTQTAYFSYPSFAACAVTPGSATQACTVGLGGADPYASGIAHPYVTLYTHDPLGNLTCVEQHGDAASGTGCSSPASSDATSPWRVRRFAYDSLSRLISSSNPETNTYLSLTGSLARSNTVYFYDSDANLLQKTLPAPNQNSNAVQTISYCYDALNRVTGKAYSAQTCQNGQLPTGTAAATYTYDQGANGVGQRTGMTDASGSSTWTYDALGRMLTWQRTIGSATKSIGYSYNLDNSLASITYPSNAVVTYAPDAAGRPVSAVDTANNINYVTNTIYNAANLATSFITGAATTFAGATNSFTYNNRLQPITMQAATPTQTLLNLTYDFHANNGDNGNVWGVTNGKDTARSLTFNYDQLNRLTSAQNGGTDCTKMTVNGTTEYWGNSYGYDAWGNLTQKSVSKCSAENLSISASAGNQLTGYNYDAAGSMISDPSDGVSVTYDAENRIASVSKGGTATTYTYDGDGNRVEKASAGAGTLYWYGLPGVLAESDLSGTIKSEYIFFNGQRVARRDEVAPTGVYYYFSDFLRSASLVMDAAGNIKAESDYYPWGGELQMTNSDSNHFKFTGKERDSESGLDYFGARFYSAALGRFMSPDWSQAPTPVPYADLSDPQSLNLYSYVRNSPVARIDADGHFRTSAGTAAGGECADGTDSCTPTQSCSGNVTSNCINSSTTTITITGAGNNNDEAVVDGTRKTVWTDSKGNQHTTVATTEVLVGGEGNWKPGIVSVTGSTTTYNSSGKAESYSHFGQVDGGYYTATSKEIAAAVGVLGGTSAINAAGIMANPDWVHNTAHNIAADISNHPIRTIGRALGIAALTVDPPTTLLGAGLAAGAAGGDFGSAMWEDK